MLTHLWTKCPKNRASVVRKDFEIPGVAGERTVLGDGEAETAATRVDARRVDADVTLLLDDVPPKRGLHLLGRRTLRLVRRALRLPKPHALRVPGDSIKRVQRHVATLAIEGTSARLVMILCRFERALHISRGVA
jgi:hypothetical protein